MSSPFRRSSFRTFLPDSNQNAVLHLILATGVCFVALYFTTVCFQAFGRYQYHVAQAELLSYIGLAPVGAFPGKVWTLLTYGLFHTSFLGWVGNAIWIYTWGSVVQMLVGHRQVIPIFAGGALLGGIGVLLTGLIPGIGSSPYLVGSQAGVMALAFAAFTLAPNYRFWLTPTFSLSIKVVLAIFIILNGLGMLNAVPMLAWLAGGALAGFLYVIALRKGARIGERIYGVFDAASQLVTPKAPPVRRRTSAMPPRVKGTVIRIQDRQARVDTLLEKILANGYDALTAEEKEFLKSSGEGA
ncbi:MAG: rhomboid family intramembrane serine protease [Sphingobacteriales bacterium]|nr:MAG: rhomboid family intramembrane serine protease [Sphingobacteriales bacterium]